MITFLKRLAAAVSTPAAGKVTLFVDSATGEPAYKDEAGAVHSLQGEPGENGSGIFPGSSTDNALVRFDGTGGGTVQNSGVLVSDSDEISGYKGNINAQTGTTYTLVAADTGKIVTLSNASAVVLTLPNSLPAGFACTVVQKGVGQVTFTPASGATRNNRSGHTKAAGQYAFCSLYVDNNSGGSAAAWMLGGDTAA